MTWPSIPARTFLDDFNDWTMAHGALGFLTWMAAAGVAMCIVAVVVIGVIDLVCGLANRGRPTVTLFTDEWVATRSHEETRSEYNVALKMPTTRRVTVVDQWTRRR